MTDPITALARLRDGDATDKPFRLKLDSGRWIEAPSPRRLADVFVLPLLRERAEIYRSGGGLLKRPHGADEEPTPLPLDNLASAIRAEIAKLPELRSTEAGRPYLDTRALILDGEPATVGAYLANIARAVVTSKQVTKYRPPAAERVERAPAMTAAERKAAQREREREAQISSARWWLEGYLTGWDGGDEAPAPGSRVLAAELYGLAVDAIEETVDEYEGIMPGESWEEIAEEDGLPEHPRVPGRKVFYAEADKLLGARRRGGADGARYYVIPEPTEEADEMMIDKIREEAAAYREAAEAGERLLSVRERLAELAAMRDRARETYRAATGTDGAVVDLTRARARRNT